MNTTHLSQTALILSLLVAVLPAHAAKLARIDREIATHAGVLGANRLAEDPKDPNGLILLQLAGKLRPTSDAYLLTVARLEKGLPIDGTNTKVSEKKLINVMRERAEKLRKRAKEDDDTDAGQLALLYYRVVEHFLPEHNKVLLGIMKLKVRGIKGELEDVLQGKISVAEHVSSPALAKPDSGGANVLFKRAKAAAAKGDHEQAQSLWERFLAVEPEGERKTAVEYAWVTIATEVVPLHLQFWRMFWSPDGKRILYQSNNEWYTVELSTRESTKIEGMADVSYVDAWSPDGRHVAMHTKDHSTYLYELTRDGQAKRTTRTPIASGVVFAFSPDGKSVLVFGGPSDKRFPKYARAILELATGKVEIIPSMETPGRNATSAMSWAPDGHGMTFGVFPSKTGPEDCAIYSARLGSKEDPVQLTPGRESVNWPTVNPDGLGVAYAARLQTGKSAGRVVPFDGSAQPVTIGPGKSPQWCADGRSLALQITEDGPARIEVHRLGGIDRRPAEFSTKQTGHTFNVAVRNRTRESNHVQCHL